MNQVPGIEQSLIGAILLSEDKYQEISSMITATDFQSETARKVFLVIGCLYGKTPVNLQTVYMKVEDRHKQWVLNASEQIFSTTAKSMAKIVADESKKKRLKTGCAKIIAEIENNSVLSSDEILQDLSRIYRTEIGTNHKNNDIKSVLKRFDTILERNGSEGVGFKTGFNRLDADYIFYRPGHLWVVGAWTSVGKSAWMVEAITRVKGASVAVFSTEMTEETNVARILANKTGVNANVILSGKMMDKHSQMVGRAKKELAEKDLSIFDNVRDIDEISMQSRKLKFGGGVDIIFIDFIQNLQKRGYTKKYEMMSQIAIDIQNLAHELRCTVVCLSQLPTNSVRDDVGILEFKGAGEIAAACDIGVLMKRGKDNKQIILFDVRKNRHGVCNEYILEFEDWVRLNEC